MGLVDEIITTLNLVYTNERGWQVVGIREIL